MPVFFAGAQPSSGFFRISTSDSANGRAATEAIQGFLTPGAVGVKKLSAILIISVILAFVASFAILRTRRSRSNDDAELLQPSYDVRGLFGESDAARTQLADEDAASEDFERELRERASRGDLLTLNEARESGRAELYDQILGSLLERSEGDATRLRALADFVARGEGLRSTTALASAALEDFEREPARARVPALLRVAALSDDASAFESAMMTVLRVWLEDRLTDSNADELRALFDAEYWLLSSEARRSGAGFQLKQKLTQVRRSLSDYERRHPVPFGKPTSAGAAGQKERQ